MTDDKLLSKLDGKDVYVKSFTAECKENSLRLTMTCVTNDKSEFFLVFENASKLNMSEVNCPFQISGFEILDYKERGYMKENRYFVNDYEYGTISFYCEDFHIFSL